MENALQIIEDQRRTGALIFSPGNLNVPPLYKIEATVIKAKPDEFHNMKGKYMPNRAVTDRISEAAGIDFIASECNVVSEMREAMPELGLPRRTVFVGYAQGRARLPDGSWRNSTKAEYEFDPVLRAKTEGKGDREALEYMKFGRQRASTGARLGVIRQLVGIPVTFSQEDISRPLVFSRIVQNTDYILGTKEGRVMAVAAAIGITGQLYGAQPAVPAIEEEPTTFQLKDAEDQSTQEADWEDAPLAPSSEAGNLLVVLEEYLASGLFGEKPAGEIKAVLDRNETDPIILRDMVDRCKAYEAKATRRAS